MICMYVTVLRLGHCAVCFCIRDSELSRVTLPAPAHYGRRL